MTVALSGYDVSKNVGAAAAAENLPAFSRKNAMEFLKTLQLFRLK
jgi:hypothetical protein